MDEFNPISEYEPLTEDMNSQIPQDKEPVNEQEEVAQPIDIPLQADEQSIPEIPQNPTEQTPPQNPYEQYQPTQTQPIGTVPYQNPQYPQPPYQGQYGTYPQNPAPPVPPVQYPSNPNMPYQGQYYQNQGQPQPPQNPYESRYPGQNNGQFNPYATQYQPTPQKKKMAKSTIYIIVLSCLLAVFVIGFIISCAALIAKNKEEQKKDDGYSFFGDFDDFFGSQDGENIFPFSNGKTANGEEFDVDVTLKTDDGLTQTNGSQDNSAKPDEKAEALKETDLPKDKDDEKYTAQSAFKDVSSSVVAILCYEKEITDDKEGLVGEGTGTVVSNDGYIVTNAHVIGNSKAYPIKVISSDEKEYTAKVVGYDTRTDLAVLKVDTKDLKAVTFGKFSNVEVGDDVVAIGNPGGSDFQNSLTKGIVSATERSLQLNKMVKYIQIDAAINPGNSGGPLCNIYGQVIGINTAKISSDVYENMGFAIPCNTVVEIANDLIHYGYVKGRVALGIAGTQVTDEEVSAYGVPHGILVSEITKGGPLDNGEVKKGDIITAVDGKEISTFQDVYEILGKHKDGDKISISVYRTEK